VTVEKIVEKFIEVEKIVEVERVQNFVQIEIKEI
jgi:hypothetical protein